MLAADGFVPLATWLAGDPGSSVGHPERGFAQRTDVEEPLPDSLHGVTPSAAAPLPGAPVAPPDAPVAPLAREAIRDLRLFRARLADALELATAGMVRDLAYAVLGRELRLSPADVAVLATRILAEHTAAQALTIRHAAGDRLPDGLPGIVDATLAPGDLVVTFTTGEVDARLGVRLAAILEAWT